MEILNGVQGQRCIFKHSRLHTSGKLPELCSQLPTWKLSCLFMDCNRFICFSYIPTKLYIMHYWCSHIHQYIEFNDISPHYITRSIIFFQSHHNFILRERLCITRNMPRHIIFCTTRNRLSNLSYKDVNGVPHYTPATMKFGGVYSLFSCLKTQTNFLIFYMYPNKHPGDLFCQSLDPIKQRKLIWLPYEEGIFRLLFYKVT